MKKLTQKSRILVIVLGILVFLSVSVFVLLLSINSHGEQSKASDLDVNNDGVTDYRSFRENSTIYTKEGLKYFQEQVSAGVTYVGCTISLAKDIDLSTYNWIPIGAQDDGGLLCNTDFCGTFNGGSHTISNLKIDRNSDTVILGSYRAGFGLFSSLGSYAKIKNLKIKNVNIDANHNFETATCNIGVGALAGMTKGDNILIENCMIENVSLTGKLYANDAAAGMIGFCYESFAQLGFDNQTTKTVKLNNCYVKGFNCSLSGPIASNGEITSMGPCKFGVFSDYGDFAMGLEYFYGQLENCVSDNSNYDIAGYIASGEMQTMRNCYTSKSSSYTYTGLSSDYWFIPKNDEYNSGWPILKSFISFTTYTINSADETVGTVNYSSFEVPERSDSGEVFSNIPTSINYAESFHVGVIKLDVIATPSCQTCRQFSHWEVNGKTITAHFKEKEVPANCTVKFTLNEPSYADTSSSIGLYEFNLYPGSTIKCVSTDGKIYTYIVYKGGDCPDCGRPLTTGEEYARITYTIKKDADQPASKYKLVRLDSNAFIGTLDTEYTITESITISPIFELKEYGVEIG